MARLPGGRFLMQQASGTISLFEEDSEREIVRFLANNEDAVAKAQKVIYDNTDLNDEEKCFAHFWSGYFYAHAGGGNLG